MAYLTIKTLNEEPGESWSGDPFLTGHLETGGQITFVGVAGQTRNITAIRNQALPVVIDVDLADCEPYKGGIRIPADTQVTIIPDV